MLRQSQQSMTARDVCRILFRHRWRSAFFLITVVALGAIGVLVTPRKYQSEATFYMKPDFRVDPAATNDTQIVAFDPERESEMRSVLALLESRLLFETVVDELGPDAVFENDLKTSPLDTAIASVMALFPEFGPKSEKVEREQAIRLLMKSIKLDHAKKSHVVTAVYKSRTAERAQEILTAYTTAAMQQHLDTNRNPSSFEFFVEQESELKNKVLEATQALSHVKNNYGVVSIASQRKVMEDHITNLDRELLSTDTTLASAEDNIASLRALLPSDMQNPEAGSALSVYSIDTMRNQLYSLELRYRELVSRFQAKHPQVVATKDQLDEGKMVLNQQQLVNEISKAAALRSKRTALQREFEATKRRLNEMNEQEVNIAQVERNAEEATANYRLVVRKLEQARIDQQLESGHISNLRLTQAPTLMGKSLSRQGLLIVSLSLIVGILGAITLAFVSELLDESLATATDVEASLGIPVLASFPRTHSPRLSMT
ncbi:MAG TPA: GumC family protein [Pirellulaceae bacterium]|nr:GumC family protein [Pirellulaceae bacterium]